MSYNDGCFVSKNEKKRLLIVYYMKWFCRNSVCIELQLHFNSITLQGCDGSVLLDSTADNTAEKEAPPNLTLRGFNEIDTIKAAVEAQCRGIVSCADILAMAVREACKFTGASAYDLLTGRLDGTISKMEEVNMPGPSFSIEQALQSFQAKGYTLDDMITLLGKKHTSTYVAR